MATAGNGSWGSSTDSMVVSSPREKNQSSTVQYEDEIYWKIERSNLLNISKICIKTLIDSSLKKGRTLDESFVPLKQFFVVMEHVFKHGIKGKRGILGSKRDLWSLLESLENKIYAMKDMLTSIHNVPSIKTNAGRSRAWVRLALMQKILAQQMQGIVEERRQLEDWYESYALMMNEESVVISGLLVGLNIIDCNLDLKGENLDSSVGVIDISLYLRDGNYLEKSNTDIEDTIKSDQKIEMILDQKAYLEELNRGLTESALNLQDKISDLQREKHCIEEEFSNMKKSFSELMEECSQLKHENGQLKSDLQRRLQLAEADISVERETYQQSRSGLNEMYLQIKGQYETEVQLRKEAEQDLHIQMAMNQEKEVAMRLLEKDVHDKQDTLMSLRKQLEEVKKINIELQEKNKSILEDKQSTSDELKTTKEKFDVLWNEKDQLEKELCDTDATKSQAMETLTQMGFKMGDIESERYTLETNLKIEREWRSGVQKDLQEERQRVQSLTNQIAQLQICKEENERITAKVKQLEERCNEQECTLIEMAEKLTRSQLHVDDMKEATVVMKEQVWKDDRTAVKCQQCEQSFSVSRRKHHCRSCGGIFCNSCSDNTMPLPSSAKPVRVCDSCHDKLLARYKAS